MIHILNILFDSIKEAFIFSIIILFLFFILFYILAKINKMSLKKYFIYQANLSKQHRCNHDEWIVYNNLSDIICKKCNKKSIIRKIPELSLDYFKLDVIEHLKGISNQNALIIGYNKNLKISDLINEVNNLTDIGKEYIENYYEALKNLAE